MTRAEIITRIAAIANQGSDALKMQKALNALALELLKELMDEVHKALGERIEW